MNARVLREGRRKAFDKRKRVNRTKKGHQKIDAL
jgi:hypothetical protein